MASILIQKADHISAALSSYLMFNYAVFVAVGVVALVAICILTICIKRNKRSARLKKGFVTKCLNDCLDLNFVSCRYHSKQL